MGAETIMAAAAATTAIYSIYAGERSAGKQNEALQQQKEAQAQATETAKQQQSTAEQNINRARGKSPDIQAVADIGQAGSKGGPAGTMLTGPTGIDPNQLSLGKNTLLGG